MLRDVFYYGKKPNAHPREKFASSFEDAVRQNTTEHFWIINEFCDYTTFDWDFDFDFLPDEDVWASDHINIWPSNHQKDSGTWLCHEQSTDTKIYRTDVSPIRRKNEINDCWVFNEKIDKSKFDFGWHPDPTEPPYIYKWGCKFYPVEIKACLEYHVPNAIDIKYVSEPIELEVEHDKWRTYASVDESKFDFTWRPDPREPAFIYVWGNKWYPGTIKPTVEYHCDTATDYKHVPDLAPLTNDISLFTNTKNITYFDYTWRPNPTESPYIYQFPTQWAKTHGPKYVVEGATETKYMDHPIATIKSDMTNWEVPSNVDVSDFDFSWHPDETSPPYIYQFGNLIDDIHLEDGPKYITPYSTGEIVFLENKLVNSRVKYPKYYINTTVEDLISEHPNEIFWALRNNIDYRTFNFDWMPDKENVFHINVFGSPESETTQTYLINGKMLERGYIERYYVEQDKVIDEEYLSTLFVKPEIFYVDRGNSEADIRFNQLKDKLGSIQKTRYLNSWVDTVNRCCNKASTELFWVLNSELDYSEFDFNYYPNPWQMKMVHVFGTQWSHWGTTFLVNKETFPKDTKYIKVIEHLSNLNFVKAKRAKATNILYDIVYVDHGNLSINDIECKGRLIIKYQDNYTTTFRKMLEHLPEQKDHYVWVTSTICDYFNFDFTYICDPFSKQQLHVFPSDNQKFGDTFLIDVNKLRSLINDMQILEDYGRINYNQHQRVKRLPAPVFVTNDTHTSNLKDDYNFPYAVYVTSDNQQLTSLKDIEPLALWNDNKDIVITSTGGTRIVAPKETKKHIKTELYDYPYIKKSSKLSESTPLDIIFFSNGEVGADENYEHLLLLTAKMKNRVVRVNGVQGRIASQHAAANASNTPWYFLVNAKLRVNEKFDFSWQPDRLQIPKHYIFLATNPVNGLEYGHQAIVANNKTLTLNTDVRGLDYTMDSEHEVVSINSGIGMYNTSPWDTWRTAFREVIKLKNSTSEESISRLNKWLTVANGDFADYSLLGAKDAVEYYESVNGEFDKLKLSYDWAWLRLVFDNKYK